MFYQFFCQVIDSTYMTLQIGLREMWKSTKCFEWVKDSINSMYHHILQWWQVLAAIEHVLDKRVFWYGQTHSPHDLVIWAVTVADFDRFCHRRLLLCSSVLCSVVTMSVVDNMRCIDHTDLKCDCKPSSWTLLYRHTAGELDAILDTLRERVECLPRWIERVNAALDPNTELKVG